MNCELVGALGWSHSLRQTDYLLDLNLTLDLLVIDVVDGFVGDRHRPLLTE